MPGPGAAECLGDRDAEKAHLGEALPQFAVKGRIAVDDGAHRLGRAFLGEKFPRRIAHLLLFVGEVEIHGRCTFFELFTPGCAKREPGISLGLISGFRIGPKADRPE